MVPWKICKFRASEMARNDSFLLKQLQVAFGFRINWCSFCTEVLILLYCNTVYDLFLFRFIMNFKSSCAKICFKMEEKHSKIEQGANIQKLQNCQNKWEGVGGL